MKNINHIAKFILVFSLAISNSLPSSAASKNKKEPIPSKDSSSDSRYSDGNGGRTTDSGPDSVDDDRYSDRDNGYTDFGGFGEGSGNSSLFRTQKSFDHSVILLKEISANNPQFRTDMNKVFAAGLSVTLASAIAYAVGPTVGKAIARAIPLSALVISTTVSAGTLDELYSSHPNELFNPSLSNEYTLYWANQHKGSVDWVLLYSKNTLCHSTLENDDIAIQKFCSK